MMFPRPGFPTTVPAEGVSSPVRPDFRYGAEPPPDPFAPFVPSPQEPWNVRRAGHLLRRAGFGGTHQRLDAALKQTPQQVVDGLLDYDVEEDPFNHLIEELEGFTTFNDLGTVQQWWVHRMLNTPRPMQERIALFWHDHFATAFGKVGQPRFMHRQIELFRQKGLGSFRDLVIGVGRDPAMLIWLDGNTSRKGKPNENYARELMELFTLGVGQYTEADIKELARAFTGWQIREGEGVLNPSLFDDGEKTILGKKGKFDSESAVDLLLSQPAAPKFIAGKLLAEFLHPKPTQAMIDHYAQRLLAAKWEIGVVLRELFSSRLFFSDWAYRSKIKSPCELAVGGALAVGGKIETNFVRGQLARMGQTLLQPPDVSGWEGEQNWVNANTVLVRFNYGLTLATHRGNYFARRPDLMEFLKKYGLKSAEDVVEHYGRVLLDGEVPSALRTRLLDYMSRNEKNEEAKFRLTGGTLNSKVRGTVHLIMASPEFQLA